MTAKKSRTGSLGKAKKLKLKRESVKDLSVKKGANVKGGLVSPSMVVKVTGCAEPTCVACGGRMLP